MSDIVIFEADAQQVEVWLEGDTLWLSLHKSVGYRVNASVPPAHRGENPSFGHNKIIL